MHADLETRRRVLMLTYQRYLDADRAWRIALDDLKHWFPANSRPGPSAIGTPGSRIRRLHDQREHALRQMEVARRKLDVARRRLTARSLNIRARQILLVSYLSN